MKSPPKVKPELLICLLLVLATGAVYGQVRDFAFVNYDDDTFVTENPRVLDGLTFDGVTWAFTSGHPHNWHPLTWLSHMLDCQFFGLDPAGHHLTSVLLHILNGILCFLVFRKMTGEVWQSGFLAALFSLHPLHVESVAWVAERKDVLSTLFWMLTMWCYAHYAAGPTRNRYLLTLLFFALGLMAKPMLVTVPFVLMLLDYWPLRRIPMAGGPGDVPRRSLVLPLIWEKLPFLALAAASSAVTIAVQRSEGAVRSLEEWPLVVRMGNALVSYVAYLGKTVLPHDLAIFYPHPGALPVAQIVLAGGFLLAVSLLVIRARRARPYLAVGWFWYLGTLVPVIGLVQVGAQAMADRYTYVPLIGVFIMIAWGVPEAASRWRIPRAGLATAAVLALLFLTVRAHQQIKHWENSITLFEHALAATERNYIAHTNLGMALADEGRKAEATRHYVLAVEANPNFAKAHFNLGAALYDEGKVAESVGYYARALELDPHWGKAHYNLGIALASMGRLDEAAGHYSEALRIDRDDTKSLNNLANVLVKQGKMDEAIRTYGEALEITPDDAALHNNLGATLASQRRFDEAIPHFRRALEIEPDDAHASANLERALSKRARAR